jgi:hypothetical protein
MKAKSRKKLIISLIQDDLIHNKLLQGLSAMNLNVENYLLNLGDTIIRLMGYREEQNEYMFRYYMKLLQRARFIDNSRNNAKMKKLAREIYLEMRLQVPIRMED